MLDNKINVIAAVLTALLALSEGLGLTDKIKANSVAQLVVNFLGSLFGAKK